MAELSNPSQQNLGSDLANHLIPLYMYQHAAPSFTSLLGRLSAVVPLVAAGGGVAVAFEGFTVV